MTGTAALARIGGRMATRGGLAAAGLVVLAGALGSAGVAAEIGGVGRADQPPLVCAGPPGPGVAAGCTALLVADLPVTPTVDPTVPALQGDQDSGGSLDTDRPGRSEPDCSAGLRGVRCSVAPDLPDRSTD